MSEQLDQFIEQLCALDVDPELLRADPGGERWLPTALREQVERDGACARELQEFVAMELSLYDMHEPCDAFFTRSVMDRLPDIEAIDDRRRTWILASAYALAIGVAYVLLGPLLGSGEVAKWFDSLEAYGAERAVETGGVWMAAALLLTAAALVVMPTGDRRSAA